MKNEAAKAILAWSSREKCDRAISSGRESNFGAQHLCGISYDEADEDTRF
jgi:hypothetical protein